MFHDPRFWTATAFVVFFLLFGRKLWAALSYHLDARAEGIRKDLDEAAKLRREAEQMLEDATREREKTLAEAKELLTRSEQEAAALAEKARRDAEETAARFEKMARDRIQAAERAAIRDVKDYAMKIALSASKEVITEHLSQQSEVSTQLVDKSLQALPEALRRSAA
ncbi:F0F1 ATP synthase subunit B family protein [Swingsia samuiensis]|uniref:ATP synthase subunit b n=1 Tax=Swingsia samuiensis TaxID=1293412 RepID=A0A4Y6UIQ3_9PROT|nr:F0F1 ATP synthase subunit B [Swingsia samuiensis]QDH16944.1 F0F1 ATP synthase subunit B [Swingsia samuiensis]